MQTYDVPTSTYDKDTMGVFPLAKVFIHIALNLLLSGVVAYVLPYMLIAMGLENAYFGITIASSIGVLILGMVVQFKAFDSGSVIVMPLYYVYGVLMGVLLSSVFLIYDIKDIGLAFVVTGGVFGIMGLFGFFTKKNLDGHLPYILMGFIGVLILSIVNFFFFNEMIYWVTSFVMFGLVMLITAIDMNRVRRMAASGSLHGNIAVYCAFILYVDFIWIFIKVLQLIGNRSN